VTAQSATQTEMSFIMTERLVLKEGVKRRNRNSVIANGFDEVLLKKTIIQ
jgi:hypothetical protein